MLFENCFGTITSGSGSYFVSVFADPFAFDQGLFFLISEDAQILNVQRDAAPIDILCDDCSGTITSQMRIYFVSFFIGKDVPLATNGCVPKPICL